MSRRLRSAPLGQEKGRSGSAETLRETASRREDIPESPLRVHHSRANLRLFWARFPNILAFATLLGAALYLVLHVAAALLGWQNVAAFVGAGIWLTIVVRVCGHAFDRGPQ